MAAATLRCAACGAALAGEAVSCAACGSRQLTVSCPACLAFVPVGARFCPHCGHQVESGEAPRTLLACPDCHISLELLLVDERFVQLCPRCGGLWMDRSTFDQLAQQKEAAGRVLGGVQAAAAPRRPPEAQTVRYRACPRCHVIMNRQNYAQISGIVLDVCRTHGIWFDRDELARVLAFIRDGGLVRAQHRQQTELEDLRRALLSAQRGTSGGLGETAGLARGEGLIDLLVNPFATGGTGVDLADLRRGLEGLPGAGRFFRGLFRFLEP